MILIDQLKEIYVDGELDTIDSTIWLPKVMRKDYVVGLNLSGSGPDPDQNLYLLYGCGGDLNYNGHCNPEIDELIDQQSTEANQEKRRRLVWEIERKLAEDGARPIIFYNRGASCWQPYVKGLTIMVNSITTAGAWKTSGSTNSRYRQSRPEPRPTSKPPHPRLSLVLARAKVDAARQSVMMSGSDAVDGSSPGTQVP